MSESLIFTSSFFQATSLVLPLCTLLNAESFSFLHPWQACGAVYLYKYLQLEKNAQPFDLVGFSVMTQWEIDTDFTRDLPCFTQGPIWGKGGSAKILQNSTKLYKGGMKEILIFSRMYVITFKGIIIVYL